MSIIYHIFHSASTLKNDKFFEKLFITIVNIAFFLLDFYPFCLYIAGRLIFLIKKENINV